MAFKKVTASSYGVDGDYLTIGNYSYNNRTKRVQFDIELFANKEAKSNGCNSLGIVYRGELADPDKNDLPAQIYKELRLRAETYKERKVLKDGLSWSDFEEEPGNESYDYITEYEFMEEHRLFCCAEDV